MQPRHRVSRTAIELIKRFEGYRRVAAQLPDGRWTLGHGHTLTARQGAEVSEDDAEALLLYDLIGVAHALNEAVFTPLTQNQFDALASFVFNLGLDNFHQSAVLRRLNEGAPIQAACAMELWRKAYVGGERIVVDALVRRRAAEKALFLTPPGNAWVPAPSPILRPLLDTEAQGVMPSQAPAQVTTGLDGDRILLLREGEPAPAPVAPEDEAEGPAKAAAEAVAARLSTIFPDSGEAAPAEVAPQPPAAPPAPPAPVEDPVPFFLRAPEPGSEPAPPEELELDEDDEPDGPASADLFDGGPGGDVLDAGRQDAADRAAAAEAFEARTAFADVEFGRQRRVIDDLEPYDFEAPVVSPLPERGEGGLLTLVALAVLGLVFFGGGIFWATYARPTLGPHLFGPRLVGGLAGIAGIGFFVVAIYLLLDRLGRVAERQARHRP